MLEELASSSKLVTCYQHRPARGASIPNVDDRMFLTMAEDLDHGSGFGFSPVFLLFNPVQLDTFWTSFGHSLDTTWTGINLG